MNLKELARAAGLKLKDVIALAPGNDPFYSCQTESTKRDADWFNYYFQELGFEGVNGIHLRRSDFDPAGKSMPVAVSRKLEWLLKNRNIEADVQVFQIALQQIQVEDLRLPRTPIKETEARRDKFEARYGQDAVELDAIEAIHPGQLAAIVQEALDPYYDHELARRFNLRNIAIERELDAISDEVYDRPELAALKEKWEELTQRYDHDFAALLDEISETFKCIKDELEERKPDLSEWEQPKPKECQATERAIFDSNRDYLSQIEAYKRFQSGDEILDYEPIPHSHQMSLGLG